MLAWLFLLIVNTYQLLESCRIKMKIAIVGASGYAGLELLRLLAAHPEAEVVAVTSRADSGKVLSDLFPSLRKNANYDTLILEDPAQTDYIKAQVVFTATPHGTAMNMAKNMLAGGSKIIDLSADFRLKDAEIFDQWYTRHQAPELLSEAVYGLPELYREQIKKARLIANPGCYPTSAILAVAPFLKAGLGRADSPIICDAKSGVTGAGRGANLGTSFCEVSDSFKAYKINGHRHTPEIEQELSALLGQNLKVAFTPHLLPMNRGILSTVYLTPNKEVSPEELLAVYQKFYETEPFVRVRPLGFEVATADVRGSNFCDLSLNFDQRTGLLKVVSVIDNLCRGASGQAVANLNLMFGLPETLGLGLVPLRV